MEVRPTGRSDGLDGDGKPTITSSDGATRIVLYGLKLGVAGVLPVEAGSGAMSTEIWVANVARPISAGAAPEVSRTWPDL